jgi:hypothetical protein
MIVMDPDDHNNKGLKYLETTRGLDSKDSLQLTALLVSSDIIRKVLQAETWRLSGGVHHWLKRSTKRENVIRKQQQHNNNNNNNNNNNMEEEDWCR